MFSGLWNKKEEGKGEVEKCIFLKFAHSSNNGCISIIKTPPFQKGGRNGGVFECIVRNCCALVM